MRVVSGALGDEPRIHFEAVPADRKTAASSSALAAPPVRQRPAKGRKFRWGARANIGGPRLTKRWKQPTRNIEVRDSLQAARKYA
jgi:hypothetical protein